WVCQYNVLERHCTRVGDGNLVAELRAKIAHFNTSSRRPKRAADWVVIGIKTRHARNFLRDMDLSDLDGRRRSGTKHHSSDAQHRCDCLLDGPRKAASDH